MDLPQLLPAMEDLDHRWRREDGDQLHEVLIAEGPLAAITYTQHATVTVQNAGVHHVPKHGATLRRFNTLEAGHLSDPAVDIRLDDAPLLQAQRHDLLSIDMQRQRRRLDRLHKPRAPEGEQPDTSEERVFGCRQE